jgi:hypothetical protein
MRISRHITGYIGLNKTINTEILDKFEIDNRNTVEEQKGQFSPVGLIQTLCLSTNNKA